MPFVLEADKAVRCCARQPCFHVLPAFRSMLASLTKCSLPLEQALNDRKAEIRIQLK